ncbi:MAG: Uma2 family endonuclease [Candidatus Competibacteraceae bacterium]|nr:Uma2 family endonuclease [Candidatus Competibacteraceae bacterium]
MEALLISPPPPLFAVVDLPAIPPTQDDLPCDDGIPMETMRHHLQMDLLIDVLDLWLEARGDGFAGGNIFLYYSLEQVRHNTFIGPDFFVALDVSRGERKSWVIWEQGKGPDVVVELLSASTAHHDKTHKKTLYARQMHVPEYYGYDPFNPEDFAGFTLHGNDYYPLVADPQGRLHSPALNLDLGRWTGTFRGVTTVWLRWFTPEGALLPTAAEVARQHTETAQQQTEVAQLRAERLAERLRQLGVDPDSR